MLPMDNPPSTIGPVIDVVDGATGRVLVSRQAYEHHAIGSITKLMTAILVVKHLKLKRVITISSYAASISGSTMWLLAGDRVPVRSLLYGLLIPSANDAAEQFAETVVGNDKGFAVMMNRQARRFHLRCSNYVTPYGLDAPHQYSCATDVAHMSRLLLSNRLLARIVSTQHIVVPSAGSAVSFDLTNTNLLLGAYAGTVGVKTGTTDAAGAAVSAAARRNGHTVIAVVLGSTDYGRFSDAAALMTFAFRDYVWPNPSATMWATESLEHQRQAVKVAPVPRWEAEWISLNHGRYVVTPPASH
jgi:D-alanyl-D-alanine carboxypeptidase